MQRIEILEKIAPFNHLDQEILLAVRPNIKEEIFPKGSFVFEQGDPSLRTLFIIIDGVAEIIIRNEKGVESVVGLRRPYDFFGETVILSEKHYPASVRAVTDCKCFTIDRETFDMLLQQSPQFSGFFSRLLTDRLRDMFNEVIQEQSYDAYGMEDAQPFRKRVADLMTSPVITCNENDLVTTAARILTKNRISSLVVVDKNKKPAGVITETDMVARILTRGDSNFMDIKVRDVMTPNPVTLPPDAFYFQALLTMVRNKVKQLPIIDNGELLGIVTLRDLVQSRSTGAITTVSNVESETTISGLIKASHDIDNVLKALVAEKASSREICEVMTELYDRLTRKIIRVSERQLLDEGLGLPPVDYCWINMGSSGRKEQIIPTDQDNGIIYDDTDPSKNEEAEKYFSQLAAKAVDALNKCGFALCKGNVMATNRHWRRPYMEWLSTVTYWVKEPHSEMLRNFTIFLDFRAVYGTIRLADRLRKNMFRLINDSPIVLHFLARDDLSHAVPLGIFRQFITEKSKEHKGETDIKGTALVHIVDCIRIFSIRDAVSATNTFKRIARLTANGTLPKDDAEFIDAAYETLLTFRNRENLRKLAAGHAPNNYLNPYNLSKREQTVLRESFKAITRLQNFTGSHFRVEGY